MRPADKHLTKSFTFNDLTAQARVREMDGLCGVLEAERSSFARRASGAEAQLQELQSAMAANMARYQKEILRLRALTGK